MLKVFKLFNMIGKLNKMLFRLNNYVLFFKGCFFERKKDEIDFVVVKNNVYKMVFLFLIDKVFLFCLLII